MATETLPSMATQLVPILPESQRELRLEDYTIIGVSGKGKFSDVFKATRDGAVCALKKFSKDGMESESFRRRVEDEIRLLQSLDHVNIVKHRGMFRGPDGEMYMELEWADGGDLRQLLKRHKSSNAHFSESRVWNFFTQIVRGVHHMHENRIMHRDLKPANILVMRDLTIKVADLGLSKRLSEFSQEMHSRVGTPLYMAPEVLSNQGYSFSSDVWSMGCILYELAALTSPFRSGSKDTDEDENDIVQLVKRVTQATYPPIQARLPYSIVLRELIAGILVPDPQDRVSCAYVLETAETQNKATSGSLSPPLSLTKGVSATASYASGSVNTTLTSSRESSRSPPLSSPRRSFSEFVGADKTKTSSLLSGEAAKLRPPALSIPGEPVGSMTFPPASSPQSARVVAGEGTNPSARFRLRRLSSAEAKSGSALNEAMTAPVVPGGLGTQGPIRSSHNSIQTTSLRSGIPQSPRLSRLVPSGTTISSPSSPNSSRIVAHQSSSNPSPRSARLPMMKSISSSPDAATRRHRRAVSATNVSDMEDGGLGHPLKSSLATILAVPRESSGSEVSSSTPGMVSDDDEKRSQNEGARARGALQRLSIATDRESLNTNLSSLARPIDPRTAPVSLRTHSSTDFRRFNRTVVPGEVYSPSNIARRFPLTPTAASEPMIDVPHHQRSNSNPFSTDAIVDSSTPVNPSLDFIKENVAIMKGKSASAPVVDNPFSTGAAAYSNLGSPRSAGIVPMTQLVSGNPEEKSPTTAGVSATSVVGSPSSSTPKFKFALWSNAAAKKRPQAASILDNERTTSSNDAQDGDFPSNSKLEYPSAVPDLSSNASDIAEPRLSTVTSNQPIETNQTSEMHYLLGAVIGEGSFAKVYRAVDLETGMSVAVKQMHIDDGDSEAAAQMEKEIGFLKTLSHPNLVKYIGVQRMENKLNIILEFCTEGSISSMLRMYKRFPDRLIRLYTKQMVNALVYLHDNNIVHRDIKGGNVLVHGEGSRGIVKLSDFGCSKKLATTKNMEKSSRMRGTVLWMAPEAAMQREDVGTPSDIWSLGATVIEMATGKPPWQEEGLVDEIPALIAIAMATKPPTFPVDHLSESGISFLKSCMEIDPRKRLSAKQLAWHEFLILEQTVQVATAEVGRRPDVVGASYNALRAAVKGRDMLMEREQIIKVRMRKGIEDMMNAITKMDKSVKWDQFFTKDVEVAMPVVFVPLAGLPCLFVEIHEKEKRIERLSDFEACVSQTLDKHSMATAPIKELDTSKTLPLLRFIAMDVRNLKELIQVESRTAMWKWEVRGYLSGSPDRVRIASGSAMATFEPTGHHMKSIEFVWEATAFLERLGLVGIPSPREEWNGELGNSG